MSKKKYYWDSCIFYEWLGKENIEASKKAGIKAILEENEKSENIIITSVITHLEVLPSKLEEKNASDQDDYLSNFDAEKFVEINLDTNTILLAREIRDFYYEPKTDDTPHKMMDLGDAIHLATAVIHKADEFHTRDNDSKKSKVPLLSLYENSGNSKLCGRYELVIKSPEADQGTLDLDGVEQKTSTNK